VSSTTARCAVHCVGGSFGGKLASVCINIVVHAQCVWYITKLLLLNRRRKRAIMDSRTADSPGLHSGFPGDPNVAVEPSAAAAAPTQHKRGDVLPAGPVVVWQSFRPQFLPAHQPALIHTFSVQKKRCKCLPLELFRGDCRSWQWQLNTAGVDGVFRN